MKRRKTGILLAVVLAVAAAAVLSVHVWGASRLPEPHLPQWEEAGDGESGRLYTLEPMGQKEIEQKAADIIGVEDLTPYFTGSGLYYVEETGDTVTIETGGLWSITNEGKPIGEMWLPDGKDPALPAEEAAVRVARSFITENGLYEGELGEPVVTHGDFTVDVTFIPDIDGVEVLGLHRLRVSVGENGRVYSVFVQVSPVGEAVDVPLQSIGRAEGCRLAYYVDGVEQNGKVYAYPVYRLSCKDGEEILLDAIAR